MDFVCTAGWMVVSTGSILSRHPELWNLLPDLNILEPISAIIPLNLTGLTSNQISDIAMVCSTCISGGLLTSVYSHGRHERLHAPLSVLAFVVSIAVYLTTRAPLDILAFGIFPWVLAGGLLASRSYDASINTDQTSGLECWSGNRRKSLLAPGKQRQGLERA